MISEKLIQIINRNSSLDSDFDMTHEKLLQIINTTSGPDRELDAEIAQALGLVVDEAPCFTGDILPTGDVIEDLFPDAQWTLGRLASQHGAALAITDSVSFSSINDSLPHALLSVLFQALFKEQQ